MVVAEENKMGHAQEIFVHMANTKKLPLNLTETAHYSFTKYVVIREINVRNILYYLVWII